MILMRSISSKLILAFLIIGIASVAILFATARSSTKSVLVRVLSDETKKDIITQLSIYHLKNGSWDGLERLFPLSKHPPPPGFDDIQPFQPLTLADANANVIISNERYQA